MLKKIFYVTTSVFLILIAVGTASFFLLQSPAVINLLGALLRNRLGYQFGVEDLSFTPTGDIGVQGLEIKKVNGDKDFIFLCSRISASLQRKSSQGLRAEVESLIMEGPHLFFRFTGKGKKGSDLSFLERIPSVKRLEIKKGSADLILTPSFKIQLDHLDLTLLNFSPQKGGNGSFSGRVTVHAREKGMKAQGSYQGSVRFSSLFPQVQGNGFIEMKFPEATYTSTILKDLEIKLPFTFARDQLSLSPMEITLSGMDRPHWKEGDGFRDGKFRSVLALNWSTKDLFLKGMKGELLPLGRFRGEIRGKLKDDFPFDASLSMEAVSFPQVAGLINPLLPEEARGWQFQGNGALETRVRGNYTSKGVALKGEIALDFQGGGFSAPDGSKAAQGLTGKVKLKIDLPLPDKKLSWELLSQLSWGEVLFGEFYRDLSGRNLQLEGSGSFFLPWSPRSRGMFAPIFFKPAHIAFPARSAKGRNNWISEGKGSPGRVCSPL